LAQISIADNRFARRGRIVGGLPDVARQAPMGLVMGQKAQLGSVDPFTLQFRDRALELFRIIKDSHSLAYCRLLHSALSTMTSRLTGHASK
jgi:hypothetical protein